MKVLVNNNHHHHHHSTIWLTKCIFTGAGLASVVISFLMSTYYAAIIAWAIYYFFTSFKSEGSWASCANRWNTPQCWVPYHNHTKPNGSQTPTEQFFE